MTKERDEMINKDRMCLLGVPCVIIGLNLGLIYSALLALLCGSRSDCELWLFMGVPIGRGTGGNKRIFRYIYEFMWLSLLWSGNTLVPLSCLCSAGHGWLFVVDMTMIITIKELFRWPQRQNRNQSTAIETVSIVGLSVTVGSTNKITIWNTDPQRLILDNKEPPAHWRWPVSRT